jgi:hypothetical protein
VWRRLSFQDTEVRELQPTRANAGLWAFARGVAAVGHVDTAANALAIRVAIAEG